MLPFYFIAIIFEKNKSSVLFIVLSVMRITIYCGVLLKAVNIVGMSNDNQCGRPNELKSHQGIYNFV